MTAKDEALKQALAVLEMHVERFDYEQFTSVCELDPAKDCIIAIKQALAAPVQEPVARLHVTESDTYPDIEVEVLNGATLQPSMSPIAVYTTPPNVAAPLVQEPVAWRYTDARGHYRYRGYVPNFDVEYKLLKPQPLYATSPAAPVQEPLQSVWNNLPSNKDVEEAMRMKRINRLTTSPSAPVQEQFGPQEILQMIVDRALEKPAAPVQEPVAWLKRHELAELQTCNHIRLGADSPRIWAPNAPDTPPSELDLVAVYTTPPAAQPVKQKPRDEMLSWCPHAPDSTARTTWVDGFRCAEISHGIKGNA